MENSIQYIVDHNGMKTSVIVPFEKWEKMNEDIHKLQNKLKVFVEIRKGMKEIKSSIKDGNKLQTLSDFLNK